PGDTIALQFENVDGFPTLRAIAETGLQPLPTGTTAGGDPLIGTVVRVDGSRVTVDHEAIPGVMGPMVMPFITLPSEAAAVHPGDKIVGTLIRSTFGFRLVDLTTTGTADVALRDDIPALKQGESLPAMQVPLENGTTWAIGEGQGVPTVVTFLYTRCPDPNFCPLLASRLQALQAQLRPGFARIIAITIDPENDVAPVLQRYGDLVGANPEIWHFGRLPPVQLQQLAMFAGMSVTVRDGKISHLLRMMVFDKNGRLVENYTDNDWDLERVIRQLNQATQK
ncbi:MAG: hypothetical protein GWP91_14080, partial [Rhodobacterales bacterium]|nr:hypothetical protein [Rhodobacterales bacterium]